MLSNANVQPWAGSVLFALVHPLWKTDAEMLESTQFAKEVSMEEVYRLVAADPKHIHMRGATRLGDKIDIAVGPGDPEVALYGPYFPLKKGHYTAIVRFDPNVEIAGACLIDVRYDQPDKFPVREEFAAERIIGAGYRVRLDFSVINYTFDFEIRLFSNQFRAAVTGVDILLRHNASAEAKPAKMRATGPNPYSSLSDSAFWRRAVAGVPPFALDPVSDVPFLIAPGEKIATAGSCFAQHIARNLGTKGLSYYVAEMAPPNLSIEDAAACNYGTFSARYGNVYTAKQLRQLFERAYGTFDSLVPIWKRDDGRFVDPFRPQIQPGGFATEQALHDDRQSHLQIVRDLFQKLDVFVFTLGLTEGWVYSRDGSVVPIAPGVAGGQWDPEEYEFKNFCVSEVIDDLRVFMAGLRSVNPEAKVIFTVSPVPLVATYENRHVLVSTVYSKSVLRVAAEETVKFHDQTCYFPSYEIITAHLGTKSYFEDDLRSVSNAGVHHVMRTFFRHFLNGVAPASTARYQSRSEHEALQRVVCDEEAVDR